MAALSNYLESGLLNFVFRGESFSAPSNISIALVSGVKEADPADADTGITILEIPSGINGSGTGYNRVNIGEPNSTKFSYTQEDFEAGSGTVRNSGQIVFNTALLDWGWVSGIAIVDSPYHNTDEDNSPGNVLMHAALDNPRIIYAGDNVKFDYNTLEISFK
jgi:hypothetical protein